MEVRNKVRIVLVIVAVAFLFTCSLFTNMVETPTIDIESGSFDTAQEVTITTGTEGATIKYTTDDSNPLTSTTFGIGKVGSSKATETVSRSLTLKAYAYMSGMVDSEVVSATYVITTAGEVGPDYAVSSPAYPPKVFPSGGFEGNFRISNASVAGSETINWSVYLSYDSNYGTGDTEIDSGTQAALAVGGTSGVITYTGTWPADPTGYYLIIILDADDELITADNVTVSPLVPLAATGRFVAVGDDGYVTYSDDAGATWTVSTDTDLGINDFTGIAFDSLNGRLVIVGSSNIGDAVALYSDDSGENWTQSVLTIPEALTEVAWGNHTTSGGTFVATANNRLIYSTDVTTSWTVATISGGGRPFIDVAFGADIFVATSTDQNTTNYSTDGGLNWEFTQAGITGNSRVRGVTYAGTRFVAGGDNTAPIERFFYTADGITWVTRDPSSIIAGSMQALAYDGTLNVVAVGNGSRIWFSSDEGAFWAVASGTTLPDSTLNGVAHGDGMWVVVGTVVTTANIWRTTNIAGDWEGIAESATTLTDVVYIP